MNFTILTLAGTLAVTGVTSGRSHDGNERRVTVYVVGGERVPSVICAPGEGVAATIFREIGVRLEWRHRQPSADDVQREQALVIEITDEPAHSQRPTVAVALPYEGSAIKVYYGSLRWAERMPILAPRLFGHVLAHEIAHTLEQVDRHSATGLMKANWTPTDYNDMGKAPLRLETSDIQLIHRGLDAREARRLAARGRLNDESLVSKGGKTR